ncbi:MAG TPA: glycogen debranching N-terminal domain-containing protein [Actinoplanes sp.]|nr:glycogen debranching N-terminal domain-containing protein [Actinoplanes sp.]
MSRQPLVHDLVATVAAPTSALSGADGQIRARGVQGVFHADARVLSEAVLRVDGREPEPIGYAADGPHTSFVSVAGGTMHLKRHRHLRPGALIEEIEVVSTADRPVSATVTVDVAADLAELETVRSGGTSEPLAAERSGDRLGWSRGAVSVVVAASGGGVGSGSAGRLRWETALAPRGRVVVHWELGVTDTGAVVHPPATGEPEWSRLTVRAGDHRFARLVDRSLADLATLRLTDGHQDTFLGAGVPWFLTLFGRDSLWAARMLLPAGTDLAAGTLRVLARRQGTRVDRVTGEAPGKILHELRRDEFVVRHEGLRLPALYYGTIDATLLWISLLHDAWRWGHPDAEVAALLPHLEAALGWLAGHADPDGDGFVEYLDTSGHGLAHQGWKDSGDAVRDARGRPAEPPIALAEVQGYAYRAAMDGAALLDAFGRPGGDRWRAYASALADRFRARFWVPAGHPALALDRDKRPVDSLTSNIGHLLGTGLLSADEESAVAAALAGDTMSGGYGLRTMSTADHGYAPLSYHCGSVWTHDTAIVAAGLARAGFHAPAATLIDELLAAAEAFDYRMPELHAGFGRTELSRPMPYPAACRPQAWSAAAAVLLVQASLGLDPDVPNGTVRLRPLRPIAVDGLRVGGRPVAVAMDGSITGLPAGISVEQLGDRSVEQ